MCCLVPVDVKKTDLEHSGTIEKIVNTIIAEFKTKDESTDGVSEYVCISPIGSGVSRGSVTCAVA